MTFSPPTRRLAHLAQRLFNVPLAVAPHKAEIIVAALADRFGIGGMIRSGGEFVMLADGGAQAFVTAAGVEPARQVGYDVVDGVAIIPVQGTLVAKLGELRPFSGMTGYDGIHANLATALADPEVRAIVFDIDSPGGEVAGAFDLADAIHAARSRKPLAAILTETAYSAAYAIASSTDRIYVPRTGGVGSIGVLAMHVDFSRALDAAGITVTLVSFGARKAEWAETAPLSEAALLRLQTDVDAMGELFVATVARNRGIASEAVRATEAATFLGAAGVANGLADAVMSPNDAFADLLTII